MFFKKFIRKDDSNVVNSVFVVAPIECVGFVLGPGFVV